MAVLKEVWTNCPQCRKDYVPEILKDNDPEMLKRFRMWENKELLIQQAFPTCTLMQREQLQTGICSDQCWDKFLGMTSDE